MSVIEQLGLRQDPFGPAAVTSDFGIAAPMTAAFEQLLAAVRRGDPLIVVVGRPGMGKTLLMNRIETTARAGGVEVRSIPRGDMAHLALGAPVGLLLIDEADTITTDTLRALAPGTAAATATTTVLASTRPDLQRLVGAVRATIIDLRPLSEDEAAAFIEARAAAAGRPDLFAPDAVETIIAAGRGSPRLLRVLAGAAMFQAAGDGAAQITPAHASLAATMHGSLIGAAADPARARRPANDAVPFVRPAEGGHPADNVVPLFVAPPAPARRRVGLLPVAASVALVALMLPASFAPSSSVPDASGEVQAASMVPGPVRIAAAAFTVAPANAAATPAAGRLTAGWAPPLRVAASPVATARSAFLPVAPVAIEPRPQLAALGDMTTSIAIRRTAVAPAVPNAREVLAELLAATRLRPNGNSGDGANGRGDAPPDGFQLAAAVAPVRDSLTTVQPAIVRPDPIVSVGAVETARPVVAAVARPTEVVRAAAEPARSVKPAVDDSRAAKLAADQARATKDAAKRSADEAKAARETADEATISKAAANQAKAAKDAAEPARATKAAAELARAAKSSSGEAKVVKATADQAKAAKDSATQARAAKDAADEAKAAKDAVDAAKAVKAAAEQAKAAKDSAAQAKAAKDAADQAKAAKDAADQAMAAKQSADQARAAKDAADTAKAAKAAVDQAKAVKETADAAKAAKDAAEQAKAAKDAVDQARAAKDAADTAKAAKDAAEQAKAAKDAADTAKAAKDAADAAQAAKDAADLARTAKDSADVAKAAKDSVDQARVAKDAAKAAKDAAKAAKDITKGLRGG